MIPMVFEMMRLEALQGQVTTAQAAILPRKGRSRVEGFDRPAITGGYIGLYRRRRPGELR